jgi:hypothetical protein
MMMRRCGDYGNIYEGRLLDRVQVPRFTGNFAEAEITWHT